MPNTVSHDIFRRNQKLGFNFNYRPQGEGNVFTCVCLFTGIGYGMPGTRALLGGRVSMVPGPFQGLGYPGVSYPDTLPLRVEVITTVGMHPTGMLSCYRLQQKVMFSEASCLSLTPGRGGSASRGGQVLISSGGHRSSWYASYWNAILCSTL